MCWILLSRSFRASIQTFKRISAQNSMTVDGNRNTYSRNLSLVGAVVKEPQNKIEWLNKKSQLNNVCGTKPLSVVAFAGLSSSLRDHSFPPSLSLTPNNRRQIDVASKSTRCYCAGLVFAWHLCRTMDSQIELGSSQVQFIRNGIQRLAPILSSRCYRRSAPCIHRRVFEREALCESRVLLL